MLLLLQLVPVHMSVFDSDARHVTTVLRHARDRCGGHSSGCSAGEGVLAGVSCAPVDVSLPLMTRSHRCFLCRRYLTVTPCAAVVSQPVTALR